MEQSSKHLGTDAPGPAPTRRRMMQATSLALLAAWRPEESSAQDSAAPAEIRIGQSAQLTGPLAPLSLELVQGAAWYFDEANAAGGIHGRRIRVITLDDGYVASRAAENARKLVDEEGVLALFNTAGTPTTLAALPVLEERRVPLVAPFTGSVALRSFRPYLFNVRADYADEIARIAEHLAIVDISKVAVACLDNAFGKEALVAARTATDRHRVTLTASAGMGVDGKGLDEAVRKIAASAPQAVIVAAAGKLTSDFIGAYQRVRGGTQFYALSVVSAKQLVRELGERSRGVVIAQVMPDPTSGATSAGRELLALARRHGASTVTLGHMEGFVSAKVLVEGLRRAGRSLDRAALVRGLESMREVDVGGIWMRFSDRAHNGSAYVELSVVGPTGELVR